MTPTESEPTTRMPAEQRRASILEAASGVFGERGYVGTTTDAVARAAGVSQPYVVRMFGTKEQLFLEVLQRALERLTTTFRAVIARPRRDDEPEELEARIGLAYADLLQDRGLLLSLMQGFMLGADPVVGPHARAGFLEIYRLIRDEAGLSPEAAGKFLSGGMMLNTLVAIRMADDYGSDPLARELIEECAPNKFEMLLHAAERTKA